MSIRPVIFISAVSKELHTARDLVAKTLVALGYEPRWQDIAATDTGDLRGVLRKWIDDSDSVLQLVGHCYGFAPMTLDRDFGACSYTQYEALYARQQGKPVYYLFIDDPHPTDGCGCEPQTLHDLQEQYRQQVKTCGDLYHNTSSLTQTELLVRRLKDDLANLRKRGKQHAAVVLVLLVLCVLSVLWLLHGHQKDSKDLNDTKDAASKTEQKVDVLLQALRELPQTLSQQVRTDAKEDEATRIARAYAALEDGLHLPKGTLENGLPQFAEQLLQRMDTSALDRAHAFFVTRKFAEAEAQALMAKDKAIVAAGKPVKDAIKALELAGEAALAQFHYNQALDHYRAAAALTSAEREPLEWAHMHWHIAYVLSGTGQNHDAEKICRQMDAIYQRVLGSENVKTLRNRRNLADTLGFQGKYAAAEKELRGLIATHESMGDAENFDVLHCRSQLTQALRCQGKIVEAERERRAILETEQRVLGAEHPDTLHGRTLLAVSLHELGRNSEAEQHLRGVVAAEERVLGPEHPKTLKSRIWLVAVLWDLGRHAEAEEENRVVLAIYERVLGPEHPDTLDSRRNQAVALNDLGKHEEAEVSYRAVITIQERVLGAEHPDVAKSCENLALCLEEQKKLPEALKFMQRAEQGWTKALGPDHPHTKLVKSARERIEAALSKSKPTPSPDAPATSQRGTESARPPRDREMDRKLEMDVRGVLSRQTVIYGPDGKATLFRRMDLAIVLDDAGKYTESEKEFRAVLKDQERVLGSEHHDVLETCFNFGHCLEHQDKLPEALALAQRVEQVNLKNLGPNNPSTKSAGTERERIEALIKK